jgi:DNA polymerase bacteriophage-type
VTTLFLDLETRNAVDIKVGTHKYSETVEIDLFGYAIDDQPAKVWDVASGSPTPAELEAVLRNTDAHVVAHNSQFDRTIMRHVMPDMCPPLEQWSCNMVLAMTLGLPASLKQLGEALGLDEDLKKMKRGDKLVHKFCKPAPKNHKIDWYRPENSPEDWGEYKEYCRQDVETLRHIWNTLPKWNYSRSLWHTDQRINDRGLPVDLKAVEAALRTVDEEVVKLKSELKKITNGALTSTSQVAKTKDYLAGQGVELKDLTKATVIAALKGELPPIARRVLEIRQQADKTSTAKYKKMVQTASSDHRIRGTHQYYGAARTGRWAGRMVQTQNMPRGSIKDVDTAIETILNGTTFMLYDDTMEVVSSCIRGMITASDGMKFLVSDLSGIEARVLPWLAGDEATLDIFRTGHDIYKDAAAGIFHCNYEDVTKDQRFIGKVATLALGYQGGPKAFITMGKNYGVDVPESEAQEIVTNWRASNKTIRRFWYGLQEACINAIDRPGDGFIVGMLMVSAKDDWLRIKLPSGRFLCYYKPEVRQHQKFEDAQEITFMGTNQYTRKWERIGTYGGKLVENVTQAVSRDILAEALVIAEEQELDVVMHTHDEMVVEVPDMASLTVAKIDDIFTTAPEWAEGLPLDAEGFESYRYRK